MRGHPAALAMTVLAGAVSLAAQQRVVKRLDGSSIKPVEIHETVSRLMKAAEVTGAGLAVFDDGKIALLKAFGVRDKERNLPLTVDSVMSAASFSKVAFAYMAMQLVDEGILDLDKPVYQYLPKPLPEYSNYKDLAGDPRQKRITARMLLSHTSGFPNWRRLEDDQKLKIHFEPGSRFAYSGEGIVLLQLVVETITKVPLEEAMQQHVFRPLGMKRSSMVWHDRFEHEFPTLSNQTTDENKGIRLSYGLGWGLYWTPYGRAFFKEGHDDGWRNYTVCFDKAKSGIVLMTNSENGEGIYKDILESVLRNTFTPIEWEGFTPYDRLPPRAPLKER